MGLGCVTFGREIDHAGAFAMMDHALTQGIDFFDTAAAYGGGASETIVGEWLKARGTRGRVTLATKILPPYNEVAIMTAVDTSRRRLGVDTLDVLFLHRWDRTADEPDTLCTLDRLARSGAVRQLGASNFSTGQLRTTLAQQARLGAAPFHAVQNIHNFAVRGMDADLRELCAGRKIALVSYSPLGAGFLTGKHDTGVQPGSRFDLIPGHQDVYFNDLARQRLTRLRAVADRAGISPIDLALAWAFRQPQIATVLVGGRTPAHLDQALRARMLHVPAILRQLDETEHLS